MAKQQQKASKLTPAGRQLMECLRAYVAGTKAVFMLPDSDEQERRELFALAYAHKLLPVVCFKLASAERLFADEEGKAWRSLAKKQAVMSDHCTRAYCGFIRQLENSGLSPVTLKGEVIKRLYSAPELRLSADEDIFIDEARADDCARAILELGYEPYPPGAASRLQWDPNGVIAFNGGNGLHIELHERLFDPNGPLQPAAAHFSAAYGRTVTEGRGEEALRVFAPTDELLYLICHAAKHFISCGFGVRIFADICAYTTRYYESINFTELKFILEQCGLVGFAAGVYDVCMNYLGYDAEMFPLPFDEAVCGDEMLYDCLDGGVYGKSSYSRAQSAKYTSGAAAGGSHAKTAAKAAFPSREELKMSYPFVEKTPLLLPAAWAARLYKYVFSGRKDAQRGMAIGRERTRLLRRYGMALGKRKGEAE